MAKKATGAVGEIAPEKVIVIPAINLQRIVVRIRGVTPLLTNRFTEESIAKLEDTQQHLDPDRAHQGLSREAENRCSAP